MRRGREEVGGGGDPIVRIREYMLRLLTPLLSQTPLSPHSSPLASHAYSPGTLHGWGAICVARALASQISSSLQQTPLPLMFPYIESVCQGRVHFTWAVSWGQPTTPFMKGVV